MEIGPIFRALINHRSRFWLITVEIALTLAVVANCITMIKSERAKMLRPTGMDVENILVARVEPFAEAFEDDGYREDVYDEDLRRLRSLRCHVSQREVFEQFADGDLERFVRRTEREGYHLAV